VTSHRSSPSSLYTPSLHDALPISLVGYAHPFDVIPDPAKDELLTDELPVDVALAKVDYIEVVGFSDHKSTANVWYRLLNSGFHRSEEHTSELQSPDHLVCRLLLEK